MHAWDRTLVLRAHILSTCFMMQNFFFALLLRVQYVYLVIFVHILSFFFHHHPPKNYDVSKFISHSAKFSYYTFKKFSHRHTQTQFSFFFHAIIYWKSVSLHLTRACVCLCGGGGGVGAWVSRDKLNARGRRCCIEKCKSSSSWKRPIRIYIHFKKNFVYIEYVYLRRCVL